MLNKIVEVLTGVCLIISGVIINLLQCLLFVMVYPFSKKWFRKINYYFTYMFLAQLTGLADFWSKINLTFYMTKEDYQMFKREHGYFLANHSYEVDWLMGAVICERFNRLGHLKIYGKRPLIFIPVVGLILKFTGSIILNREFAKDKENIEFQISELGDYPDPIMLFVNSEGTRFTEERRKQGEMYAKTHNLPDLKHVLHPRTKGFIISIPKMRGKFDSVLDGTLAIENEEQISFSKFYQRTVVNAHFYINRISMDEIPNTPEGQAQFLHQIFQKKDRMLESFKQTGDMFSTSGVERISTIDLRKSWSTFYTFLMWNIAVHTCILLYFVKLVKENNIISLSVCLAILSTFYYFHVVFVNEVKLHRTAAREKTQ